MFMPNRIAMLVMVLVAMVAMPAIAHADSNEVLTIGDAEVRVRVVGGKTYLAVKSGTLTLKYPDGQVMATIPAGTAMMVEGLDLPQVVDGTLQFGNLAGGEDTRGDVRIAVSPNSPAAVQINAASSYGQAFSVSPGSAKVTHFEGFYLINHQTWGAVVRKFNHNTSDSEITGTDRDLLSETN